MTSNNDQPRPGTRKESALSSLSRLGESPYKSSRLFRRINENPREKEKETERLFNDKHRSSVFSQSGGPQKVTHSGDDKHSVSRSSGKLSMPRSQHVRGSRVARKCTSLFEVNSSADEFFDGVDKDKEQSKESEANNGGKEKKNTINRRKKQSSTFSLSTRRPKGKLRKTASRAQGSIMDIVNEPTERSQSFRKAPRTALQENKDSTVKETSDKETDKPEEEGEEKNAPSKKGFVNLKDADASLLKYASESTKML